MPELPEVEQFRQLLLPLISTEYKLNIERIGDNHRILLTDEDINSIGSEYNCTNVIRKGKQLCLVLTTSSTTTTTKYLYLHMGMTGRVRVKGRVENWGGKNLQGEKAVSKVAIMADENFPPKYTYLIFSIGGDEKYQAYFCDPRKFGSCYISDNTNDLDSLAPDAYNYNFIMKNEDNNNNNNNDNNIIDTYIIPRITNQRLGIKAILLDQKRAVSGVGNWVADEVLYQAQIHPDQNYLTTEQAKKIWETLHTIVTIAVDALKNYTHYPEHWLFGYRWTGKKSTKDALGRNITFITSGGRTTAIVSSIQKLKVTKKQKITTSKTQEETMTTIVEDQSSSNLVSPEPSPSTKQSNRSQRATARRKKIKEEMTTSKYFQDSNINDSTVTVTTIDSTNTQSETSSTETSQSVEEKTTTIIGKKMSSSTSPNNNNNNRKRKSSSIDNHKVVVVKEEEEEEMTVVVGQSTKIEETVEKITNNDKRVRTTTTTTTTTTGLRRSARLISAKAS